VAPERPGGLVRHLVYLAGEPTTTPASALNQGAASLLQHASRLDRVLAGLAQGHRVRVDLKFVAPIGGAKKNDCQFTAIDDHTASCPPVLEAASCAVISRRSSM
jgi:hypothetical protein